MALYKFVLLLLVVVVTTIEQSIEITEWGTIPSRKTILITLRNCRGDILQDDSVKPFTISANIRPKKQMELFCSKIVLSKIIQSRNICATVYTCTGVMLILNINS